MSFSIVMARGNPARDPGSLGLRTTYRQWRRTFIGGAAHIVSGLRGTKSVRKVQTAPRSKTHGVLTHGGEQQPRARAQRPAGGEQDRERGDWNAWGDDEWINQISSVACGLAAAPHDTERNRKNRRPCDPGKRATTR